MSDFADALARLRDARGLFVPTPHALPVGSACVVEILDEASDARARVDGVVVARRAPGGSGGALAPGVTVRAIPPQSPPRVLVAAAPCATTVELVEKAEALLRGERIELDVLAPLRPGDRVRVATGTAKWPTAVAFGARVDACAWSGGAYRCALLDLEPNDRRALHSFVERMRPALAAQEASSAFRAWRPTTHA